MVLVLLTLIFRVNFSPYMATGHDRYVPLIIIEQTYLLVSIIIF